MQRETQRETGPRCVCDLTGMPQGGVTFNQRVCNFFQFRENGASPRILPLDYLFEHIRKACRFRNHAKQDELLEQNPVRGIDTHIPESSNSKLKYRFARVA